MNDGSENYNSCCIGCRAEKKGRIRVLSRGACSKSKRHSQQPAFQAAHQRARCAFGEAIEDSAE